MAWLKHIWDQLKNLTAQDLVNALDKQDSGWTRVRIRGSRYIYHNPNRPPDSQDISIHFHPGKTYGPKQLKDLLDTIGWTETDLRRLKLIH
jgi:predicted RNA binding protein YcfA (HicA-like mRNA interferase family)